MLSPRQQAAKELLARRAARQSAVRFAQVIDVPGKPATENPDEDVFLPVETTMAKHHQLLLETLDRISKTPYGRMMIFMPPGSAKSTYASVVFPAYYLGSNPGARLILASYGGDLALKHGRRTRSVIKQPRYAGIFNSGLTKESSAADSFSLTNGSEYMACGLTAGITGNRAWGLIIDDPVKNAQDAKSKTIQDNTRDEYISSALTRLIPGGWVCLIQTRWNLQDLAGGILPDNWNGESGKILCKDGNVWEVLCLQAKCEVENDPLGRKIGEYLWPEWFPKKHWEQYEIFPSVWNALFQQRPTALEGDLFKPDRITVVDAIPSNVIRWCRGWDLASTIDGDWTAGVRMGRMEDGRYIISHVARFRKTPDERDTLMLSLASQDSRETTISIPQDPGQAGKTQIAYLSRQFAGYKIESSPETGKKDTRAEPFASQVNLGNVLLLRGDWNYALIEELRNFRPDSKGQVDDQVDACSRAFSYVMQKRKTWFG